MPTGTFKTAFCIIHLAVAAAFLSCQNLPHYRRSQTLATQTIFRVEKFSSNESPSAFMDSDDDLIDESRVVDNPDKFTTSDYSEIRKGKIFVQHNFLQPGQITALQHDIQQLKQCTSTTFLPSGLSNRIKGDENIFGESDRMCCTITPDLFRGDEDLSHMRYVVEEKLELLKDDLEQVLSSQQFSKQKVELELAEMYYSISPKGSHLPRHQDERHEDTKGEKAWINETRRSISWLIYLNHNEWGTLTSEDSGARIEDVSPTTIGMYGSGGEFRAYCRPFCNEKCMYCGSNEGDIQVGWLRRTSPASSSHSSFTTSDVEFEPVFLDSWVKTPTAKHEDEESVEIGEYDSLKWRPLSALYRIRVDMRSNSRSNSKQNVYSHSEKCNREYLSTPFGPESPGWPSENNLDPVDFSKALALQMIRDDHKRQFVGVEDIELWNDQPNMNVVDINPNGGTLVLFDSVVVPHEVLKVKNGTRLAIAGWFHERQQDFPEWYGT